jgi:RNA polymerase sigma-70 factor (subfamily 1)
MTHGNEPTNGRSLEGYRSYLYLLARLRLRSFPGHLAVSDIVHDVLLKAHAHKGQFRGHSEGEWRAWLRRILANTITDAIRDPANEPMIRIALEKSSLRLEAWLAAEQTSASGKAEREERLIQLADALAQLSEEERTALELRYMQEEPMSLAQIAQYLGRPSAKAVAGLLARGLKKMRRVLREPS